MQYRADINQMKPLTMSTPLTLAAWTEASTEVLESRRGSLKNKACLRCPEPAVVAKLLELRGDVNLMKGPR